MGRKSHDETHSNMVTARLRVIELEAALANERRMHADTNESYRVMCEAHERAREFLRLAEQERDRLISGISAILASYDGGAMQGDDTEMAARLRKLVSP